MLITNGQSECGVLSEGGSAVVSEDDAACIDTGLSEGGAGGACAAGMLDELFDVFFPLGAATHDCLRH